MSPLDHSSPVVLATVPSFFNAPVGELEDIVEGDLAVVGIYCDHYGEGQPGARFYPRQLRYAYATEASACPKNVHDLGDLSIFPLEAQRSARIVTDQARRLAEAGARTLAISGDYGLTSAFLAGIRQGHPGGTLGVLRISGQPDLASSGSSDLSRRNTSRRITSIGEGISISFAGLSGLVPDEERAKLSEFCSVTAHEYLQNPEVSVSALTRWGRSCDKVYLSVDADVLLPSQAHSARRHGVVGLSVGDVAHLIQSLLPLPLIGAELTGFIPDLDVGGRTRRAMCLNISDALLGAMQEALV